VNQPKAPGIGARTKASRYSYNQGKISKFLMCFVKRLKRKSKWIVMKLPCFQEEMIVKKDSIGLEKNLENKQIKKIV